MYIQHNTSQPFPPQSLSRKGNLPPPHSRRQPLHGRLEVGIRRDGKVMRPVAVHVVDGDGGRRAVDVGGPAGRVGKGEPVAAARAEVPRRAARGRPRRAALAQRRELPVRAVGLGAGPEERVLSYRGGLGHDVAAGEGGGR